MTMMTQSKDGTITIRRAEGLWVVRADGAVIAESKNALEVTEGGSSPVIYFPRDDVGMAFLEASSLRSTDTPKGDVRYFTIHMQGRTLPDAAWSHEAPQDDLARLAGHIAFASSTDLMIEGL